MSDEHILSLYQASSKDDIIRQIEDLKREYVQAGTVAKPLTLRMASLKVDVEKRLCQR